MSSCNPVDAAELRRRTCFGCHERRRRLQQACKAAGGGPASASPCWERAVGRVALDHGDQPIAIADYDRRKRRAHWFPCGSLSKYGDPPEAWIAFSLLPH